MGGVVAVLVLLEELEDLGLAALEPFLFALDAGFAVEVEKGVGHGFDRGERGGFGHGVGR